VIVFWNSDDDVLTDFLKKGATVNSEHYTKTLKNLKTHTTKEEAEFYVLLTVHLDIPM
jgi:hypothetical protein